MNRNRAAWLVLAWMGIFLLQAHVLVIPALPCSFYGEVAYNGQSVPDGTLVEALVEGVSVVKGYTQTYQGRSVYALNVPADDGETDTKDGGMAGDDITFRVGGLAAGQTGTWRSGTNNELNLSVDSSQALNAPQATPPSTATQTPIAYAQAVRDSAGDDAAARAWQPAVLAVLGLAALSIAGGAAWKLRKKKS